MSFDDDFASPAQPKKITEFEDCLLLITALETQTGITTAYGPADATLVDVVVLAPDGNGEDYRGMLVFQKALQGQLRPRVGTGVRTLGTLTRGTAKPGQDPPWILADPTDRDRTTARAYQSRQARTAAPTGGASDGTPPF